MTEFKSLTISLSERQYAALERLTMRTNLDLAIFTAERQLSAEPLTLECVAESLIHAALQHRLLWDVNSGTDTEGINDDD